MKAVCTILCLIFAAGAFAQAPILPDAVRQPIGLYFETSRAKTGDHSEAGTLKIVTDFIRARKTYNDKYAEKNLSFFYKTRITPLRACFQTITETASQYRSLQAGESSISAVKAAFNDADLEMFVTDIITMLSTTRVKDDEARDRANRFFGESARRLSALKNLSPPVGSVADDKIHEYPKQHLQAQGARIRLISLGAALPDRVAAKIAQRLVRELKSGVQKAP